MVFAIVLIILAVLSFIIAQFMPNTTIFSQPKSPETEE
jgi:hypothetical protein